MTNIHVIHSTFVLRGEHRQNNQPTMSDLLPAVLLNALRQYKFAESPLWRMADGKDHVKIEVTFRKPTNQRFDKKGAESRRRPTPPAGEWPRQPAPARRPVTRPTPPASLQPTTPEKETTPPAQQTLQIDTATITVQRPPKTAQITPSPTIQRPATPPPSPETPPPKKPRTKSPKTTRQPKEYFHVNVEEEYPLHEKYDLQDIYATSHKVIVKAARQPREDEEISIDLPAYFVYQRENKHWLLVKGPTSKFYDDPWYTTMERLIETHSVQQTNTVYWYDTLEESCRDPLGDGGGPPLLRLVPPSYLGMTYSK